MSEFDTAPAAYKRAKAIYTKKELSVFVEFLKTRYQNTNEFYFGVPVFTQDNNPRGDK